MILDSTFLHDLIRDEPAATDALDELVRDRTPIAVSSLTVFEVGIGLRGASHQYRAHFRTVVDDIEVVPLGDAETRTALTIQRELYNRGEPIGAIDALIAGTAAERDDASVLTRNVDEFGRVDRIETVPY